MYYLNSIQLHKASDFIVNYSLTGYDSPNPTVVTIDGDEFEEWYNQLEEKAWESFDEMANDGTGIFMYMRKYFEWLDEQHGEDADDWSICPYDDYRDSLQND